MEDYDSYDGYIAEGRRRLFGGWGGGGESCPTKEEPVPLDSTGTFGWCTSASLWRSSLLLQPRPRTDCVGAFLARQAVEVHSAKLTARQLTAARGRVRRLTARAAGIHVCRIGAKDVAGQSTTAASCHRTRGGSVSSSRSWCQVFNAATTLSSRTRGSRGCPFSTACVLAISVS